MRKNRKGVSLVALVITIIVLVIITATVVINLKGNNNIIQKAKNAATNYSAKEAQEILVANIMQYKADMIAQTGTVGNLADMIAYFEERNMDVTVVDLSNIMADFDTALNSKYNLQRCVNIAGEDTNNQSIVNNENVFLKLKGNDYLFAMNASNFDVIGEIKEIGNTTVIKDAINEIAMLEEIIFKVKAAGLEINAENLQANNTYSNYVTIDSYIQDTDMSVNMSFDNNKYDYEISKLAIRGLNISGDSATGLRIKRTITLVAQATFNNSGIIYNIRANGVIEGQNLAQNLLQAEDRLRNSDMEI